MLPSQTVTKFFKKIVLPSSRLFDFQ